MKDKAYVVDDRVVAAKADQFVHTHKEFGINSFTSVKPNKRLYDLLCEMKQRSLDSLWSLHDAAAAGDESAKFRISMGQLKPPPTRIADKGDWGFSIHSSLFAQDGKKKCFCKACGCLMYRLVGKNRHQFCSNACADAAKVKWNLATPRAAHAEVPCQSCGELFVQKRSDAKFCSSRCRVRAHRST